MKLSLRTLFILLTVLGLALAGVGAELLRSRRQHAIVRSVENLGARIEYQPGTYRYINRHASSETPLRRLLITLFGTNACGLARTVYLGRTSTFEQLSLIRQLPTVNRAIFVDSHVSSEIAQVVSKMNLEHLALYRCSVERAAWQVLGNFSRLKSLDIAGQVPDLGFVQGCQQLRELAIEFSTLDVARLCSCLPENIEYLSLRGSTLGNPSAFSIYTMPKLWGLSLSGTNIDDDDLEAVSRLDSLVELDISETSVSSGSLRCLKDLNCLRTLRVLEVSVEQQDIEYLRSKLTECRIYSGVAQGIQGL